MKRKISASFIILFFIVQNLFSGQVDAQSISKQSYYIQVGAYKKLSSIQKVAGDLNGYDIYLEPYKNMYRVKVVNILTKEQLKSTLREIKKVFPKAFVTKRPSFKKKKTNDTPVGSVDFSKSFKPTEQKQESIQLLNPTLDSNSILKTRKSFL